MFLFWFTKSPGPVAESIAYGSGWELVQRTTEDVLSHKWTRCSVAAQLNARQLIFKNWRIFYIFHEKYEKKSFIHFQSRGRRSDVLLKYLVLLGRQSWYKMLRKTCGKEAF